MELQFINDGEAAAFLNANPQGINQYTKGGESGKGSAKEKSDAAWAESEYHARQQSEKGGDPSDVEFREMAKLHDEALEAHLSEAEKAGGKEAAEHLKAAREHLAEASRYRQYISGSSGERDPEMEKLLLGKDPEAAMKHLEDKYGYARPKGKLTMPKLRSWVRKAEEGD
jgi:hypothetical protein